MFKRFRRKEVKTSQQPLSPGFADRGPKPKHRANVGYIVDVKKLPKLHRAVWKGKQDKVKKLLVKDRRKLSVTIDMHERTALHYAVCKKNLHIVDLLLNCDIVTGLFMQDDEGNNPLHKSIECDWLEVTVRLTKFPSSKEAVVMRNHRGRTPLHFAAQFNDVNGGKTLLDAGASVDVKDNDGHCPLALATLNHGMEFIELMKMEEAIVNTPNEKGETPLTHAVRANDLDIVKQLLTFSGINPCLSDNAGMSPLEYAKLLNYTKIYNELERNLTEIPELENSDSKSDTPFTQNDFETFPTIMVKAECQTRELTSNKIMLDSDDLEIVAIGTEEHYEKMKDPPSPSKVEEYTCIMEVDKEPSTLVTENTQDLLKETSGGNKEAIISVPIITDCAIPLVTDYNDSMSPSLSGVVANTKVVTPANEATPLNSDITDMPHSSVTPHSSATPIDNGSPNRQAIKRRSSRRRMRRSTIVGLSFDSSDEDSSMETARIKHSPSIEGSECSPCADDSPVQRSSSMNDKYQILCQENRKLESARMTQDAVIRQLQQCLEQFGEDLPVSNEEKGRLIISELQTALFNTQDKLTQALSEKTELQSDLESTKREKSIIDMKLSEEKIHSTCYLREKQDLEAYIEMFETQQQSIPSSQGEEMKEELEATTLRVRQEAGPSKDSELSKQQGTVLRLKRELENERDERYKMAAMLESAETAKKSLENKVKTERSARQEQVISLREKLASSKEEINKLKKKLQSSADTNLQLQDSLQSMQLNYNVQSRSKDQVAEDGMCHETDPEETRAIVKEHQQVVQEGNETLKGTLNQSDEATDEQSEIEKNRKEMDLLQNELEEISNTLKSTYESYVAYIWKMEEEQNVQTNMHHHLSRRERLRAKRLNRKLSKQTQENGIN